MAEIKWTKEQRQVIELRDRNILVSAAAGSGKTAVLVERIISMISEGENPVDIDRLLIVTFTNAAASEMKERIGKAIEAKFMSQPSNVHLHKQIALLHSAQITTIHSFCLNVIRNYFNRIDLDPSFRIAEEAELKLLQSDVCASLLEKRYEEAEDNFIRLVENYSAGKTDTQLESLVLLLYHFSISYPWPKKWLNDRRAAFEVASLEELETADWMQHFMTYSKAVLEDLLQLVKTAKTVCLEEGGPYPYEEAILQDEALIIMLQAAGSYQAYYDAFKSLNFARLSAKRDSSIDPEKKDRVKELRDRVKKSLNELKNDYFFQPMEEMLQDIMGVKDVMGALIDLTLDFATEYKKAKEERNVLDFNDLEHFALNILVQEEDGESVPTPVAEEYSRFFEEVLIDEYQDSNLVQELILNSVSKERHGTPNLFMVGDVKQSIYKFRMARPDLFMRKHETYTLDESKHQRIDLHKNFRSRAQVIDAVNQIFHKVMKKELGGIRYDEQEELNLGANYPESEEASSANISNITSILLTADLPPEEESKGEALDEDYTTKELEAKTVASVIKELIDEKKGMLVFDGKTYRKARYGDIVILFRSMSGWSDVFVNSFMEEGIPAFAQTQSGYFSTIEIKTILNLLKIIDNPRQDIPLAAILHSPIVGLSAKELAIIKLGFKKKGMYDSLQAYVKEGEETVIIDRIQGFLQQLEAFRSMLPYTSISNLIRTIVEQTGYYHIAQAMPSGDRRVANIDMLVLKAVDFESTDYHGLFDFNRYIEKLQRYDVDFGEAVTLGENENAVRIMSIHKSKGLEFPIVIVAGLGKNFNNQDARSSLVLHPDLGLGPDYINEKYRVKSPTIMKKVLQKQIVLENLGEELRVLYVALTRAKEKLILSGYIKNPEKKVKGWCEDRSRTEETLSYQQLSKASTYLDWILPALAGHPGLNRIAENGLENGEGVVFGHFEIKLSKVFDMVTREVVSDIEEKVKREELLNWDKTAVYDSKIHEELLEALNFVYPYQFETEIHGKITVSELKRLSQQTEEESEYLYPQVSASTDAQLYVPEFIKAAEKKVAEVEEGAKVANAADVKKPAAYIGTIYHKVLENIDLQHSKTRDELTHELTNQITKGLIRKEEVELVSVDRIFAFTQSELAHRMAAAQQAGLLYREQPFVIGMPSNQINPKYQSEVPVLIQGIIDAFFEEEDGLVLVDYKTDHVTEKEVLIKRYQIQLSYYQKALEQITQKKVKERIIYSFALGEVISI